MLHYFAAVGSVLLALLFAADAYLPRMPERSEPVRAYGIRIASERKGPEAITFRGPSVDYGRPQEHVLLVNEPGRAASPPDPIPTIASVGPQPTSAEATSPPQHAKKRVAKRKPRPAHDSGFAELQSWRDSFASSRQRTLGWW